MSRLKFLFAGSKDFLSFFSEVLSPIGDIVDKDPDICIFEINNIETVYKLPKKFKVPTLLFVHSNDKEIISEIRGLEVSGVIFPPLNGENIRKKIGLVAAQKVSSSSSSEDLDVTRAKILAKAENIPPLPKIAQDLIKLTRSAEAELKKIVEKIKMDQGFSAKVLKLINSPFYGIKREINSIDRASSMLGVNTIKNLTLALSTMEYFSKNFSIYSTSGQSLWEHSLLTAQICEEIAFCSGKFDSESAYLAGLMHDLGKVVLVDFLVKKVESKADESAQLGIDHSEVGEFVLTKWSIDKEVTNAVAKHHIESEGGLSALLYFANLMAKDKENINIYMDKISKIINTDLSECRKKIESLVNCNES